MFGVCGRDNVKCHECIFEHIRYTSINSHISHIGICIYTICFPTCIYIYIGVTIYIYIYIISFVECIYSFTYFVYSFTYSFVPCSSASQPARSPHGCFSTLHTKRSTIGRGYCLLHVCGSWFWVWGDETRTLGMETRRGPRFCIYLKLHDVGFFWTIEW